MAHSSLKLIPGVDVTKTPVLNEAAISVSQLIRFAIDRSGLGLVQKLGGWTRFFPTAIWAGMNTASKRVALLPLSAMSTISEPDVVDTSTATSS